MKRLPGRRPEVPSIRWALCPIAAVTISVLSACSIEPPLAPSWDASFRLPILSDGMDAAEIFSGIDSVFTYDEADPGSLRADVEVELEPVRIADALVLEEVTAEAEHGFHDLDFDVSVVEQSVEMLFREIYPEIDLGIGSYRGTIFPFSFAHSTKIDPLSDYDEVGVESGSILVRVHNGLPVAIFEPSADPSKRRVELRNEFEVISDAVIQEAIAPGATATIELHFDQDTLHGQLRIRVVGTSPGSEGVEILIDPEAVIGGQVIAGDPFSFSHVVGSIEPQSSEVDVSVVLDGDITVTEAVVKSGSLEIHCRNDFPLGLEFHLMSPSILRNNQPVEEDYWLPASSNTTILVDLDGTLVTPTLGQGEPEIHFVTRIITEDLGSRSVELRENDRLVVDATLRECTLSRVVGHFVEPQDIEPLIVDTETSPELDGFHFDDPIGFLVFDKGLSATVLLNLVVESPSVSLTIAGSIPPSGGSLAIDSDELADFLNAAPPQVTMRGWFSLGDGLTPVELSATDELHGRLQISTPLRFAIEARTDTLDASLVDDIDDDLREIARDRGRVATLVARFENELPLGLTAELYLGEREATVFESPLAAFTDIKLLPATVGNDGRTTGAAVTKASAELNEDQLDAIFSLPEFWAAGVFHMEGTGDQVVSINGADAIRVEAHLEFTVLLGDDS